MPCRATGRNDVAALMFLPSLLLICSIYARDMIMSIP